MGQRLTMKQRLTVGLVLFGLTLEVLAAPDFILSCSATNDLFRLLRNSRISSVRAATPLAAVQKAATGAAVLMLADGYPAERVRIDQSLLDLAETKRLRLFLEYPEPLTGFFILKGQPRVASWERGIVSTDLF